MPHSSNILNYYGTRNAGFLHPKGEKATRLLLEKLDCKPNDTILEFGFGTGATIVKAATTFKSAHFFGIEFNPLMFKKAQARMRLCGIKNIQLVLNTALSKIPFNDNYFDAIYIESVLAIQEENHLELLMAEIHRILKPNGKIVINEGIWADSFLMREIREINAHCKSKFGIIQATERYPYIADWKTFLENNHFQVDEIQNLKRFENSKKIRQPFITNLLSNLYSLFGHVMANSKPSIIQQRRNYHKEMKMLATKGNFLEGYLITARKLN